MTPLSDRQRRELRKLARMPDSAIDYSDARALKSAIKRVHVGRFYKPTKEQISLRLDADVLAWFRARRRKYETYMNEVLRREMQSTLKRH